ncbi:MAG: hypothetical protein ACRCW2_14325 [Cellulosilyticaceae bacterium]
MGASVVNLQVWTSGNHQEQVSESIVEIVERYVSEQGFNRTASQEVGDWSVGIAYASKTSWVGVYENQYASKMDCSVLEALGLMISSELDTHVLVNTIHDSDVLIMKLLSKGTCLACYNSRPECVAQIISEEEVTQLQSSEQCWKDMLITGKTVMDLQRIWEEDVIFAEATLAALAQCIGLCSEQGVMTFEDLQDSEECNVAYLKFKK